MKGLFQNIRNPHKFLYVAKYNCYHYYVFQFLAFENGVENRYSRGARWRKGDLTELLSDYIELWEV